MTIELLLLLLMVALITVTGKKGAVKENSPAVVSDRCLLPRLIYPEDDRYILEFTSSSDLPPKMKESCKEGGALLRKVAKELGVKIHTIDIAKRSEFAQLYEAVGGMEYGGLPFYYNRRTGQAIGGVTKKENVRKLVAGYEFHDFTQSNDRSIVQRDSLASRIIRKALTPPPKEKGMKLSK